MKSVLLIILAVFIITGCSETIKISQETSSLTSVSPAIFNSNSDETSSMMISTESKPTLTENEIYMKCFYEGKYDVYNLKIGDPIQKAIEEFGLGEKKYYGLGADCYDFADIVVSYAEGTESYENRVIDFDIVGNGITAFGTTTGLSTIEDVKKIFGEPEAEWMTGHYTYESITTFEDPIEEGKKYFFIQYSNHNKNFDCSIDFYFEYGILKVISLGKAGGFD